jgi:molybdopterin-guanine dinucleotide biosynthesis protein A
MAQTQPKLMPRTCEICILAGGLSRRMGRDKTRVRLGKITMLGQVRAAAAVTGLPVRIIRRDRVRRCGPIGGVYTALASTSSKAILFLACDMPFVSSKLMLRLVKEFQVSGKPLFVHSVPNHSPGFPFVLPKGSLEAVSGQIQRRKFSLGALAKVLKAKIFRVARQMARQLANINEPKDLESGQVLK